MDRQNYGIGANDLTNDFIKPYRSMQCSEANRKFGTLMDMAQKEPILLEKYGRPFAVILSYGDYKLMKEKAINSIGKGFV